jgi:hypothetical protein
MKNQKLLFKNKIITFLIICGLFITGVSANTYFAQSAYALAGVPAQTQTKSSETNVADNSIPEQNAQELEHFSHKENGLLKFGTGMLGVLVSAIIIFLGLKIYQKYFMRRNSTTAPDSFGEKNSLDSPHDIQEAINLFLDKTDD